LFKKVYGHTIVIHSHTIVLRSVFIVLCFYNVFPLISVYPEA